MFTKPQLIKAVLAGFTDEVWKECQRYGVRLDRVDWTEESGFYKGSNSWIRYKHQGLIVTFELYLGKVRSVETAPV